MTAWQTRRGRSAVLAALGLIVIIATGSALILAGAVPVGPAGTPTAHAPSGSPQPGASSSAVASASAERTATANATPEPTPTYLPLSETVDAAGLIGSLGSIRGFWAIAVNRLYVSADGGASWKGSAMPSRIEGEYVVAVSVVDELHAWLAYGGPDSSGNPLPMRVFRTRDGGATWQPTAVPANLNYWRFQELLFTDAAHGFIFAATPRSIAYRTTDGGETWIAGATATEYWSVTASDTSTLWRYNPGGGAMCALCGKPLLHVSRDAGGTWSLVSIPGFVKEADYYSAGIPGMYFATPSLGFLAVYGKGPMRIFGTSNAGRTWAQVATTPEIVAGFSGVDASFWYCFDGSGDRKLLVTEDAGKTWRTEVVDGWSLGFADRHHAYRLARTGEDESAMTNTLFVSADGGRTWTPAALPAPQL